MLLDEREVAHSPRRRMNSIGGRQLSEKGLKFCYEETLGDDRPILAIFVLNFGPAEKEGLAVGQKFCKHSILLLLKMAIQPQVQPAAPKIDDRATTAPAVGVLAFPQIDDVDTSHFRDMFP